MLCAVVCLQWSTLVIGFFHFHEREIQPEIFAKNGTLIQEKLTRNVIELSLTSLLTADFASAAVLISFGVVLGKTSPLQLFLMQSTREIPSSCIYLVLILDLPYQE